MNVYKLDLFKRNSRLEESSGENRQEENHRDFSVLGHFDLMRATLVKDAREIFAFERNETINNMRYFKYTNFIYSIEDQEQLMLVDEELQKTCAFALCCLKIRKTKEILDESGSQTADGFFKYIKEKIFSVLLEERIPFQDVQILFCTGIFDVFVIVKSEHIHQLLAVPSVMHKIYVDDKKSRPLFFPSPNEFFAFHGSYDLKEDKPIDIYLNASLHQVNWPPYMEDFYRKMLYPNGSYRSFDKYGEFNFGLSVKKCSLNKLLYSLGIRHGESQLENPPIDKAALKNYDAYVARNTNSVFTRLQIKEHAHHGAGGSMIKYIEESVCENGCGGACADRETVLGRIQALKGSIEKYIPLSAERTLMMIFDACETSLNSYHRCYTGYRLSHILEKMLDYLEKHPNEFTSSVICRFLGNVCTTMNIMLKTDSIDLEYNEGDDFESIHAVTKFLHSYENIIRKTHDILHSHKGEFLLFLTIDPAKLISAERYFEEVLEKEQTLINSVISINIPSTLFFNPYLSAGILSHEIAHHVIVSDQQFSNHNKILLDMVKNHVASYVYEQLCYNNMVFDSLIFMQQFNRIWEHMFQNHDFKNKVNPDKFIEQCMDFMVMVCNYVESLVRENQKKPKLKREIATTLLWFSVSLRSLAEANDYIWLLNKVISEARADMIMSLLCDYNAVRYIKFHHKFLVNDHTEDAIHSTDYQLRLAAVITALIKLENRDIQSLMAELGEDLWEFMIPIKKIAETQEKLLEALVDYLCDIHDVISQKQNKNEYPVLEFYRVSHLREPSKIIKFLMNEWFDNVKYWESRK